MAGELKFFSPEWCAAAIEACNASERMYQGFKDPKNFTHRMEFGCTDRDLPTHVEWKEGQVAAWGPAQYDESDLWLKIHADIATWREVAEGKIEGGTALMAGRIKFVKGPMSAAIENGGAFNGFLAAWGDVPTDWDI
ncbi:SCP2 sterol-binding domain-containing protein [Streptomyces sp. NPDC005202]|uniref:SCP2 sterol-binding domain-containing protein n=1 Tax=Streptomyces sp. NPDC005202 TaxID=3157021 RepID=UPI0033AB842C